MISIIIPVYNTEKYLHRCLDSILDSTCGDFEVILINDGSTDRSPGICEEYSAKDSRIKVIHQKNQGVSAARNRGISECSGEWIIFVDSDDHISPGFLSMVAQEKYKNTDLLLFDFVKSTEDRKSPEQPVKSLVFGAHRMPELLRRILVPRRLSRMGNADFRSPCARAYKKSIIDQYSIRFSPDIAIGEDLLFNMEYQLRARSCVYTPIPVYVYDIHTGSATHGFCPGLIKNHARLQAELKKLLTKCHMFSALETEFYSYSLENMTYVLIHEIFNPDNPAPYHTKRRQCASMRKNSIYRKAMAYNTKTGILPRKILVFFFWLRCYPATALISHISYLYLTG